MNKEERAILRRAVERARRLLEDEVADQLEGAFGILQSGKVLDDAPGDPTVRQRLLELITHHQAGGETVKEAVERATRELAFTTLNRFVALKMAERRGLVRECISKGPMSDGIRELADCAPGLRAALPDGGYRLLLEAVMDEISLGLSALFDRRAPAGLIWPRPKALDELLDILNAAELAGLWEQDETIGWVYQYFNPKEEREAMRKASAAPRNSRELAVRNQFFTPRYVVAFLTDNTLGRIWYEMRKGDTALRESCRYLVRRPSEVFLEPGEPAPPRKDDEADLAREELLRRPVYIEHRPKKDPRDIKVLDPACGSGHFLLYAFELLERIYEEAWADAESPASEATGRTLREDYGSIDELRRAAPKLIIEHNLHGIDIDPRAVQIAALALWLRAQRAWQGMGLKPIERPQISRSNIVTAEPMPGEVDMRRELVDSLRPRVLGQLVDLVFERMRLAGEAGSLLKIEEEIKDGVAAAREQWLESAEGERQLLFPGMGPARPEQQKLRFDLTGVDNERFWEEAESRILEALQAYSERAENGRAFRRRLFAEDAARGFAFVDLCRKRYDVVLMNPPFGEASQESKSHVTASYPRTKNDVYAAFVERGVQMLGDQGILGAITSRTGFFLSSFRKWREEVLLKDARPIAVADLGYGVLDTAMVETAAYVVESGSGTASKRYDVTAFVRLSSDEDKASALAEATAAMRSGCADARVFVIDPSSFQQVPGAPFAYWIGQAIRDCFDKFPALESGTREVQSGASTMDDFRFLRLFWEVPASAQARSREQTMDSGRWVPIAKGGAFSKFYSDWELTIDWWKDGAALKAHVSEYRGKRGWGYQWSAAINGHDYYFKPGLTWPRRTQRGLNVRVLPRGCIIGDKGPTVYLRDDNTDELTLLLALMNSRAFEVVVEAQMTFGSYEVGVMERTPMPSVSDDKVREHLRELGIEAVQKKRDLDSINEVSHSFQLPALLSMTGETLRARITAWAGRVSNQSARLEFIQDRIEHFSSQLYGMRENNRLTIEKISVGRKSSEITEQSAEEDEARVERLSSADSDQLVADLASWLVGVVFGRWDVRLATGERKASGAPEPFDPLPICSQAMLTDDRDLPSAKAPAGYPLSPPEDGIVVDDPGIEENQPHCDDIVRRVREVLNLLWKERAHEIEQEACEMLGVSTLRDYFRKPSGFFDDHLKRYAKSRRKAPIYWPLSTDSGTYTVWVYYHRLTEDTLYRIVSDYVSPKISQVEDRITQREVEHRSAQGRDAARLAKELSELTSLLQEMKELRDELLRVAHLPYRPNLNDGVQITAAPLWRLFRLPRWRSELERTWQALERGDYDWAHLAYAIWPERVRETCRRDRSIAIAHGLEELYEERSAPQRHARRRRGQAG